MKPANQYQFVQPLPFLSQVSKIQKKKFVSVERDTLRYAIERTRFRIGQLNELIALADAWGGRVAKTRKFHWVRELDRKSVNLKRFEATLVPRPQVNRPLGPLRTRPLPQRIRAEISPPL